KGKQITVFQITIFLFERRLIMQVGRKIKFFVVTLMFLFASVLPVSSATYDIFVNPEDDIVGGKARYGFSYGWETLSDNASADPNEVLHWYESWSASGESLDNQRS
ncbi:MAG: hypothetical protein R6U19_09090, partial [Bacteroidales bacterium]